MEYLVDSTIQGRRNKFFPGMELRKQEGGGDRHFFLFVISKFPGVEFHTWDFLRCGVLLNSTQSLRALQPYFCLNQEIFC